MVMVNVHYALLSQFNSFCDNIMKSKDYAVLKFQKLPDGDGWVAHCYDCNGNEHWEPCGF
jgi:hypothetical protein